MLLKRVHGTDYQGNILTEEYKALDQWILVIMKKN